MLCSIALSAFVGIGNIIADRNEKLPNQRLDLSTDGCERISKTISSNFSLAEDIDGLSLRSQTYWKELHKDDSFAIKIWSISYIWQPAIGCVTTLLFGAFFSFVIIAVNRKSIKRVHKNLLSKPWLRFWERIFSQEMLGEWIDYGDEETFRKANVVSPNSLVITGGTEDLKKDNNNETDLKTYAYGTIPKVKLDVSNQSYITSCDLILMKYLPDWKNLDSVLYSSILAQNLLISIF